MFGIVDDPLVIVGWQVDPVLIGGLLALALVYGLLVGPLRERLAPSAAFERGPAIWFGAALATFYLVEGSPLHDLAERYVLSAHMLQHLLLSYVVARMFIVGVPAWLWRVLLLNRVMAPISKVMLRPTTTFLVFSIFFGVWHVPVIYEGALVNATLHHVEHVTFLVTAIMLWWPVLSPISERPRASSMVQLAYLFALPIAQLPVFAAITFSPDVVYRTYEVAPRAFAWLSPISDQALAGAIMKVMGLAFFSVPFTRIFFAWYRRENRRNVTQRDMRRNGDPVVLGVDGVTGS